MSDYITAYKLGHIRGTKRLPELFLNKTCPYKLGYEHGLALRKKSQLTQLLLGETELREMGQPNKKEIRNILKQHNIKEEQ